MRRNAIAVVLFLAQIWALSAPLSAQAKTRDFSDQALEQLDYLADALNIKDERDELKNLRQKRDAVSADRINYLQGRITHRLLLDFFEINSLIAEISDEIETVEHAITTNTARKYRNTELMNIANFAATGTLTAIEDCLSFPRNASPVTSNTVGLCAATGSVALSAAALWLNSRIGKTKVRSTSPSVLVYVFDPGNREPMFPLTPIVAEYLHGKSEQKSETRASRLIAAWKEKGLLRAGESGEIAQICQLSSAPYTTLAAMRSQAVMLRNLRTLLLQTNKGLMKIAEDVEGEEEVGDQVSVKGNVLKAY